LNPKKLLSQSVDFYEIWYRGHAIEGDLNAIISIPVASAIPKWWTLKLLTWMQNSYQSMWYHETLYADRSSDDE
jgi:hypothetical protein